MRKGRRKRTDELRPEYDFSKLGPSVRGKYAARARAAGSITVVLSGTKRSRTKKAAKRR